MVIKIGFGLLWLGFIAYAFLFAPPNQPDTFELIQKLSTGEWEGINPLIIALFNLMGILPLIYACLVLIDGKEQKIWAWPFAVVSFGVGAFALLPYLALRQPNSSWSGSKDLLLKLLDSPWTGIVLTLATVPLLAFGLIYGNWGDFIQQWQTSRFIHVMSLDFCLLCVLFPALLGDDIARRGIKNPTVFWTVTLTPLLGSLAYLCLRPTLPERIQNSEPTRSPKGSLERKIQN
ncbi:MAG: DUF2834 domain-containing protein [Cyanobacteria bacterium QS_7_48_42]|nr:MAG: DUF2834 domain-containing protein [Cyanobacteria bacterium QS_7_48_42]